MSLNTKKAKKNNKKTLNIQKKKKSVNNNMSRLFASKDRFYRVNFSCHLIGFVGQE